MKMMAVEQQNTPKINKRMYGSRGIVSPFLRLNGLDGTGLASAKASSKKSAKVLRRQGESAGLICISLARLHPVDWMFSANFSASGSNHSRHTTEILLDKNPGSHALKAFSLQG
jgi:hypothetical protein